MLKENNKRIKWKAVTQKSGSLLSRYIIINYSLSKQISKISGLNYNFKNYKYVEQTNFFNEHEINYIQKLLKEIILSKGLSQFKKEYEKHCDIFFEFISKYSISDLRKYSDDEILSIFKKWEKLYAKFWAFVNFNFFSIRSLTIDSLRILRKITKNHEEAFNHLVYSGEENYIQRRESEIVLLAEKINKSKKVKIIFQKNNSQILIDRLPEEIKASVKNLYKKYQWMGLMFFLGKIQSTGEFLSELGEVVNSDPAKIRKETELKCRDYFLKRTSLEKRLKIKGRFRKTLEELRNLSDNRTEELENLQKSEFYSLPLLKEIANRLGLNFPQLIYLTSDEITSLLKKRNLLDKKIIKQRRERYALLLSNGHKTVLGGEGVNKIKEGVKFNNSPREINGTVACRGVARGLVKIITDSSQLGKVDKGDILIALMTTPDYVMAMKKSAAIVTNDGGITCHASIISRELGKPCIIGTKIATKVLHDGDLVEVDAGRGIVKILNK